MMQCKQSGPVALQGPTRDPRTAAEIPLQLLRCVTHCYDLDVIIYLGASPIVRATHASSCWWLCLTAVAAASPAVLEGPSMAPCTASEPELQLYSSGAIRQSHAPAEQCTPHSNHHSQEASERTTPWDSPVCKLNSCSMNAFVPQIAPPMMSLAPLMNLVKL